MKHKLLQINTTVNSGSTGKIAEDIGKLAMFNGWKSFIAYGRGKPQSESNLIRIGNDWDMRLHGVETRLLDNHGLASIGTTKKFIKDIERINPDIIHLHNIHGYYLNYPLLFNYLKKWGGPVVWTLHDCWPYTGHCAYYTFAQCNRWQYECHDCLQTKRYPQSLIFDRSKKNYKDKQDSFLNCPNLTLVAVSNWLKNELSQSFLKDYRTITIYNGINTQIFKPNIAYKPKNETKIILGVANVWDKRKGLDDFIQLRKIIPDTLTIILVGLSANQISNLPKGIIGIKRTESIDELVKLYNKADVYVNTSVEETMGLTTVEAMSCGTPAIVYNSTASPEIINKQYCKVAPVGDIERLAYEIEYLCKNFSTKNSIELSKWAAEKYDKREKHNDYIRLYNDLLSK